MKPRIFLLIVFCVCWTLDSSSQEENKFPQTINVKAIPSIVYSCGPCHLPKLTLGFTIQDTLLPNLAKNIVVPIYYSYISTVLKKIGSEVYSYGAPLYNSADDDKKEKKLDKVYIGLYYKNKKSQPVLIWISELNRKRSMLGLSKFLRYEGVYKNGDEIDKRPWKQQLMLSESNGVFRYTQNNKEYVAVESSLVSGRWTKYQKVR